MRDRHHAAGYRGRRPAGRAAGRMTGIPRVPGGGKAHRLRRHRRTELRHVGAADSDESGRGEHLGEERRHRPGHVPQGADAERRRLTGDQAAEILEQDRHAAERAAGQVTSRFLPRQVESRPDHGIQVRIKALDPEDGGIDEFKRADLAAANQVGLRGRV